MYWLYKLCFILYNIIKNEFCDSTGNNRKELNTSSSLSMILWQHQCTHSHPYLCKSAENLEYFHKIHTKNKICIKRFKLFYSLGLIHPSSPPRRSHLPWQSPLLSLPPQMVQNAFQETLQAHNLGPQSLHWEY